MFTDRYNRMQLPIYAGVPIVFNLPAGNNVTRAKVIINGSVTIAGSTAAGTAIELGGVYRLIRSIKVICTPGAGSRYPDGAVVDCTPISLLQYATAARGQGKFIGPLSGDPTLGAGANGTYPIYFSIPIFFGGGRHPRAGVAALNMNETDSQGNPVYTTVQVKIEFAQLANELFSGNNGTLSFNAMCEWFDERFPMGDTIPLVQEDHVGYIAQANERWVDQALPRGGRFTEILYMAQAGQPGAQLSNSILQRVHMEGPDLNLRLDALDIQQDMLDNLRYDPSTTLTGLYALNFYQGNLANAKAARGLSHRIAVLNPSGSGNDALKIYTRRVYPGVVTGQ